MAKVIIELEASNAQVAFLTRVLANGKKAKACSDEPEPKKHLNKVRKWSYYSRKKLAKAMKARWAAKRTSGDV
jgi:hypothetical protein